MDELHIFFPPSHWWKALLVEPAVIVVASDVGNSGLSSRVGVVNELFERVDKNRLSCVVAFAPVAGMEIFDNIEAAFFEKRKETLEAILHIGIMMAAVINNDVEWAVLFIDVLEKVCIALIADFHMHAFLFHILQIEDINAGDFGIWKIFFPSFERVAFINADLKNREILVSDRFEIKRIQLGVIVMHA